MTGVVPDMQLMNGEQQDLYTHVRQLIADTLAAEVELAAPMVGSAAGSAVAMGAFVAIADVAWRSMQPCNRTHESLSLRLHAALDVALQNFASEHAAGVGHG